MKSVETGAHLAANFLEHDPELRFDALQVPEIGLSEYQISTDMLLKFGDIACYNQIVGLADRSLLLPAAIELYEGNLSAGAFLVQAQVELAQAGVAKPQPLVPLFHRYDPADRERVLPAYLLPDQPSTRTDRMSDAFMRGVGRMQTNDFMPTARKILVNRRMKIAYPSSTQVVEDLMGGGSGQHEDIREVKMQFAANYRDNKVSYWDAACKAVGTVPYGQRVYGEEAGLLFHHPDYSLWWTGECDVTQLSMVLDVANPCVRMSILKNLSMGDRVREMLGKPRESSSIVGSMRPRSRDGRNVMLAQAESAILDYMYSAYGKQYHTGQDKMLRLALLVAEIDRFNLLGGLLEDYYPNADAINLARVQRIVPLTAVSPQFREYLPEGKYEQGQIIKQLGDVLQAKLFEKQRLAKLRKKSGRHAA